MSPGKQYGIVHIHTSTLFSAFEQAGCRQSACWKEYLEQANSGTVLGNYLRVAQ